MAKPGTLSRLAYDRGVTVPELVKAELDQHGTVYRAAISLNVYPNAIYKAIKRHGIAVPSTAWK